MRILTFFFVSCVALAWVASPDSSAAPRPLAPTNPWGGGVQVPCTGTNSCADCSPHYIATTALCDDLSDSIWERVSCYADAYADLLECQKTCC